MRTYEPHIPPARLSLASSATHLRTNCLLSSLGIATSPGHLGSVSSPTHLRTTFSLPAHLGATKSPFSQGLLELIETAFYPPTNLYITSSPTHPGTVSLLLTYLVITFSPRQSHRGTDVFYLFTASGLPTVFRHTQEWLPLPLLTWRLSPFLNSHRGCLLSSKHI